jgi:hypothetical protein
MNEIFYMHVNTGSVDTENGWCVPNFNELLLDGSLVEVKKDLDNEWIEA